MSKLKVLANNETVPEEHPGSAFIQGFITAFELIDENLAAELVKLAEFQPHGERLMTLKLYKAKIAGILKDMEQDYD